MELKLNKKNNPINDELEWDLFYKNSNLNISNFPTEVNNFNRLIMHTNNFFVIAGYGAFNEGYAMIVSKKLIPSFANIDQNLINEFNWFKNFTKKILSEIYEDYNVAVFEHGLCACLGGLDRAHIHFMPYLKANKNNTIDAINHTLKRRRIGDQVVKFKDYELNNPDDIDIFLDNPSENKNFKLEGSQYTVDDIISNYSLDEYPLNVHKEVEKNNSYIFFDSGYKDSSFITLVKINTQFGREIVFNIDYNEKSSVESLLKKNNIKLENNRFLWRWQDYSFNLNIINTIKKTGEHLNKNYKNINDNKYNLISF